MMEKLGEPQTHIGLKAMIKEVDEDNDGQISFREVSCSAVEVHTVPTYRCTYVSQWLDVPLCNVSVIQII